MPKSKPINATRYKAMYRGNGLYVIVDEKKIFLSMANKDKFKTLAGLALLENFANTLLREGVGLEEIAGICFESSYNGVDLPKIIHDGIMYHVDRRE